MVNIRNYLGWVYLWLVTPENTLHFDCLETGFYEVPLGVCVCWGKRDRGVRRGRERESLVICKNVSFQSEKSF